MGQASSTAGTSTTSETAGTSTTTGTAGETTSTSTTVETAAPGGMGGAGGMGPGGVSGMGGAGGMGGVGGMGPGGMGGAGGMGPGGAGGGPAMDAAGGAPGIDDPGTDDSAMDDPGADDATSDDSTSDDATTDDAAADDSTVDDAAADDAAADDSTVDDTMMASPGCGSASPLTSDTYTLDINGAQRNYVLDVPANYDPETPYRLIFVWHPLGGSAGQVVNGGYDGLKSLANDSTIFVAPDGTDGGNAMVSGRGWWNDGNKDMNFFSAMFEELNAGLCIDQERIFSTGFSFGGMMSYTIGNNFDVFRALGPTSGNLTVIPNERNYDGPVAIMAFHGASDDFVTTQGGREALESYRQRNGCSMETMPTDPSPCVEYQGCEVPTLWCEYPGAHAPWGQMPQAVWNFFSQF